MKQLSPFFLLSRQPIATSLAQFAVCISSEVGDGRRPMSLPLFLRALLLACSLPEPQVLLLWQQVAADMLMFHHVLSLPI
jgi:hypothetical protein